MALAGVMRSQMRRACQKDGESRKHSTQLACAGASALHREVSMMAGRTQSRSLEDYEGKD